MKPLSQTQEKLPPGWLTQCPWGPHTPEGATRATLVPASNPQPSTTATEMGGVSPTSAGPAHSPHPTPSGSAHTAATSASPARARRPGLRAVLATHVLGARTVVVALQVVAAGPVPAGAWLAEVSVHLGRGASMRAQALLLELDDEPGLSRVHTGNPQDPGPIRTRHPGLCSQSLQERPTQTAQAPQLDGNTCGGQAPPTTLASRAALFRCIRPSPLLPAGRPAIGPPPQPPGPPSALSMGPSQKHHRQAPGPPLAPLQPHYSPLQ